MKRTATLLIIVAALLLAACSTATEQPAPPVDQAIEPTAYPEPQVVGLPTITPSYPSPAESGSSQGGAKVITNYKPQTSDGNLNRANVFIDMEASEILTMESAPVQVTILLKGDLPDPCHELRAVPTTDEAAKRVDLEVYTLAKKGGACITVLQPFEATIPLGSFSGGTYEVYINGEKLGEFDS
jgi:hypothetical protein